jgi:predicted dehydrogenase
MTGFARPTELYAPPGIAPAATRVYRGAVIGLGGIARQAHLPGFLDDPAVSARLKIVASVDGGTSVVPLDGVQHFASREQLIEAGPIDFVDICTPTASHLDLTLWALEQGYHVLCEKPVATTRAEARRIADAARSAGRVVMPCHQYRYNPVWLRVREWLDGGAIGRWHLAEFHVYRMMADRGTSTDATPWRGLAAQSRGGVLLDHGTHLIYQLLDAAGVPGSVRAWTGQLRHADYDVEDSAHLLFEYENRLGVMFLTWAARHRENRVRFIGEHGTIEWVGGELRLDRGGEVQSFDYSAELQKSSYPRWFSGLFRAFAHALDAGAIEPHLQDLSDVAAVLEGAYRSAETGCAEEVRNR